LELCFLKKNVILISRTSHVNANNRNVLSIAGKTQLNVKISAKDSVSSIPSSVDLLIVTVKSYDTKSAIDQAKQIIHDKTVVLSLQNGLDNIKAIEHVVERRQIIAYNEDNPSGAITLSIRSSLDGVDITSFGLKGLVYTTENIAIVGFPRIKIYDPEDELDDHLFGTALAII